SIDGSSSNIERMLERLIGKSQSSTSVEIQSAGRGCRPDFIVEVERGRMELDNPAANRRATIEPISLLMTARQLHVDECDLAIGNLTSRDNPNATSDWMIVHYGTSTNEGGSNNAVKTRHVTLRAADWKLDRLGPIVPRWIPYAEIGGAFSADATLAMSPSRTD